MPAVPRVWPRYYPAKWLGPLFDAAVILFFFDGFALIGLAWAGLDLGAGWVVLAVAFAIVCLTALGAVAKERAVRVLRRHDWLLCPRCCYPLDPAGSKCPECGTPFTAEEVRKVWQRLYQGRRER